MKIQINQIVPNPKQPRKNFNQTALRELADSIEQNGLIHPILVEPTKTGYVLVAGERRLRAFKLLGLKEIEAIVRDRSNHSGRDRLITAIVENIQREDMDPIEEANAYKALMDEYDLNGSEVAIKVGKSATKIYQSLSMLKLPKEIQQMISGRLIPKQPEVIQAFLSLKDPSAQVGLAQRAARLKLKVPTILEAAGRLNGALSAEKTKIRKKAKSPAMIEALEKSGVDCDDDTAPARWNALMQLETVPPWGHISKAALNTCEACELRPNASPKICGRCPLVDHLSRLMEAAK